MCYCYDCEANSVEVSNVGIDSQDTVNGIKFPWPKVVALFQASTKALLKFFDPLPAPYEYPVRTLGFSVEMDIHCCHWVRYSERGLD